MPRLCVNVLGGFQATLDGVPLSGLYDQVRALLVYLMVESDRAHRREWLTELLWPDEPEFNSKQNLRQALLQLRSALGDRDREVPFLLVDRRTVQFNRNSTFYLDAACLQEIRRSGQGLVQGVGVEELQNAEQAYAGDFLEGFHLPSNAAFEAWQERQRELCRNQVLFSLAALSS